jgi:hypothetical protein
LRQFLEEIDGESLSNSHIYMIDAKLAVDFIVRYESLHDDLARVCNRIGVDALRLPRAKAGIRSDSSHYREIMTPEERDVVERVCAREIGLLQYSF